MAIISTHILDTGLGKPVTGIAVYLAKLKNGDLLIPVGHGLSDERGRIDNLLHDGSLERGATFCLEFLVDDYFKEHKIKAFFPKVTIHFLTQEDQHYHVPLLLSPFGFSTYRGC